MALVSCTTTMTDALEKPKLPETPEEWLDQLYIHLRDKRPQFLHRAQEALGAFPTDGDLLLLTALASLLEEKPDQSLRYLKRFEKRYFPGGDHWLLYTLTLAQQSRWGQAHRWLRHSSLSQYRSSTYLGRFVRLVWSWVKLWGIRIENEYRKAMIPSSDNKTDPLPAKTAHKVSDRSNRDSQVSDTTGTWPQKEEPSPLKNLARLNIQIPVQWVIPKVDDVYWADAAPHHNPNWYDLRSEWSHFSLLEGFDELLCLSSLRDVQTFWFQVETVRKVLKQFRGRVLLADEVGLGKTIEAGMVLKEYLLRGMVGRFLVLTPATMVGQWRDELVNKFEVHCATSYDSLLRTNPSAFWAQSRIIASLPTARRPENMEILTRQVFDLVIVDEAHHLKNRASQNWRLVNQLRKRFLLMLSATPVQNSLVELYNLLTLLKPGVFKTQAEFARTYVTPGKPRLPANRERLRDLMRDCMIRNTRALVDVHLPKRHATTLLLTPGVEELECYQQLNCLVQEAYGVSSSPRRLSLRHLLVAAGSSPAAAQTAIGHFSDKHESPETWRVLLQRYQSVSSGCKETALLEFLRSCPLEKKIIFVHHRATLERLSHLILSEGIPFVRFEGAMSGPEKDRSVALFQQEVPVLLSTESGGEGRNLQFCSTLVNFDLPWNPMMIEQRIGRLHRIGQSREVFVLNLAVKGTLEEYILKILDEKINMFELVVGEIGAILGELEEEQEFGDWVFSAWMEAQDGDRHTAFEKLGSKLAQAQRKYEGVKVLDEELFGDAFVTE